MRLHFTQWLTYVMAEILYPVDVFFFCYQKVNIDIEYVTHAVPSTTLTLSLMQGVATSLPIAVNVEDFFRGKRYIMGVYPSILINDFLRLFSKFTISTTTHQHVRIASAQLIGPENGLHGVKIASCLSSKRGVVVSQPDFHTVR